jgi:4-hydroxybenzoate polyprenyltransferase
VGTLIALVRATRPRQWTKNVLVYVAFFFTLNTRWGMEGLGQDLSLFGRVTLAFLLFCLLSAAVYLINDLVDLERDRRHPRKRLRPIAAGRVAVPLAAWTSALFVMVGLALSFLLSPWFGTVAAIYFLLTLAYSLTLKQTAIIDVLALSGGYVLRAVAGAVVIAVPISPWLYVLITLGALLIGFGKRRNELVLAASAAGGNAQGEVSAFQQREVLRDYSAPLLDQFIAVVTPSTLIAYILYTFTAENLPRNHAMMLTIPFVLYGLLRYLYLVYHRNMGESPEDVLLTDRPLIAAVGLWLVAAVVLLLVFR